MELPITGWDWMMRLDDNGAYKRLSNDGQLINAFTPASADEKANLVFSYLSAADDGENFTQ